MPNVRWSELAKHNLVSAIAQWGQYPPTLSIFLLLSAFMSQPAGASRTATVDKKTDEVQKPLVIRLRVDGERSDEKPTSPVGAAAADDATANADQRPPTNLRVTWDTSVVEPPANQRTSKSCCIYHKPRAFGESDSESCSDDSPDSDSDRDYGKGECRCRTALR